MVIGRGILCAGNDLQSSWCVFFNGDSEWERWCIVCHCIVSLHIIYRRLKSNQTNREISSMDPIWLDFPTIYRCTCIFHFWMTKKTYKKTPTKLSFWWTISPFFPLESMFQATHDVVPQRLVRDLLSWGMIRERFNWAPGGGGHGFMAGRWPGWNVWTCAFSRWWNGETSNIFYFQPKTWGNDPIWQEYFSRGVETTN